MDTADYITLLVADEFELVHEGIARLCGPECCIRVVAQCSDGLTALRDVETHRPQIAIVDIQLPKLHCLEVIRRARMAGLETRFIVLAGRAERKLALEALRAGASGFVLKAASSRQLHDAIQSVACGSVYVAPELEFEKVFIGSRPSRRCDPVESLSSREYQVFRLLVDGIRAKDIAARLSLSPKTIDTYRASLMRKLDIHDVAGLVRFAIQREMVAP